MPYRAWGTPLAAARSAFAMALVAVLAIGAAPALGASAGGVRPTASVMAGPAPEACRASAGFQARADLLLANRYQLRPHPIVTLPANPRWDEDPLHDRNWQFQYHSLRFVTDLFAAWRATGRVAYRDRAIWLLRDWLAGNPRSAPPSIFSWNDHSTALRAVVFACAADLLGLRTWLRAGLELHGRTLASPGFYVRIGNHALNQSIGLLEVGRVLGRADWMRLARDRLGLLVIRSVDEQGVANEQAVFYQDYDYVAFRRARDRLRAVGLDPGPGFARVDLMPRFLAQATLPDGTTEMLGDTEATPVPSYPGTWTEFVASAGAHGPRPPLIAAYTDGYLFARSGWGDERAFSDETFLSVRWGDGPRTAHGHPDGTSVTLYAWGSRLLIDPGKWTFNRDAWRRYFTSRAAHDVVTVDGLAWRAAAPTTRLSQTATAAVIDVRLATDGYAGVHQTRRVTWSRGLDYLLVEDRLTADTDRTFRQLWHLREDTAPTVDGGTVTTHRARGNVLIRQLVGSPAVRVVTGRTAPIQGWISYHYGLRVAAPVVESVRRGRSVSFLTLIVPAAGDPRARVTDLRITDRGYAVTVAIGGRSERVVASGASITVTPLVHQLPTILEPRHPTNRERGGLRPLHSLA